MRPMKDPAMAATMFSPSPRPRSPGGNASVMIALEFAISIAPPTPWKIRMATSHSAAATPCIQVTASMIEKNVKIAKPAL